MKQIDIEKLDDDYRARMRPENLWKTLREMGYQNWRFDDFLAFDIKVRPEMYDKDKKYITRR